MPGMPADLLIYGAYGFTGRLVSRAATRSGLAPILAGRRTEPLEELATQLDLEHRAFSLTHQDVIEANVAEADAVLNCAGPFSRTAGPMVDACLAAGTDYLDIAGRIETLESIAERDRAAEKAGVTLLPAVGFNVVPTDCLLAFLDERVDDTARLDLAIDGFRTFSPGTVKSIIDAMDRPGAIRADGAVRTVPAAWRTREVDFGDGPTAAVTVPWGDVSTAYYSTGAEHIETYATVPGVAAAVMRRSRPLEPVLAAAPVKRVLERVADAVVSGPSARKRAGTRVRVWGEAMAADGSRASAILRTPDPYTLTGETAVAAAARTLDGDVTPGFQTPATAFGPEFILDFEGVDRELRAEPAPPEPAGVPGEDAP